MSITDNKMHKNAKAALSTVCLPATIASATSQTDLKIRGHVPGFAFEVVRVEVFAKTVTATLSVDVKIGTTSCLASVITPVADTPTAGTLATTVAARRGTSTEAINWHYTTNGSGAFTGMSLIVWVRPIPMNGEVHAT